MDDECCVMEEKSLLGRLYANRKRGASRVDENDGLSEYSRSETLSKSSWLPDGLRRRMSQRTFDDVDSRQSYPVMDWLKEIRLSCDLYDVGLPTKNCNDDENPRRDEHWSSSEQSEDWNYVEETIVDERLDVVTNVLARRNDQKARDVEYENNVCGIDKDIEVEDELPVECESDLRRIDEEFEIEDELPVEFENDLRRIDKELEIEEGLPVNCENDRRRIDNEFGIEEVLPVECESDLRRIDREFEVEEELPPWTVECENDLRRIGKEFGIEEGLPVECENDLHRIDKEFGIEEGLPVECENDLHRIDKEFEIEEELPVDDEEDERGEEIFRSNGEYRCGHDKNSERKEETCLTRRTFDKIYGSSTNDLSSTKDSSVTRCFRLESENSKSFGLNNSSRAIELSGLLFCADDDETLKYCDRYYENSVELLNDYSRSPTGTSRTSECSTEDIVAAHGLNDEICPYDSLEINLDRIEDEPFSSDLEIDESHFQATRFYQNYISDESTMPGALWSDQAEIIDDARLERRFCVSSLGCDRYDLNKYSSKSDSSNTELSDSAKMLEKNIDHDEKTTMPVMHWVATFNNFDGVRKTRESTERSNVDTFNIFDGTKYNDDEPSEFSDDYSKGLSDTENSFDAGESVEKNENIKEYRRRKGSVSSDVVEWKKNLWDMFLDDEECGDEWFSSNDAEGKIYFFEENSNESSWVLPAVETDKSQSPSPQIKNDRADANGSSTSEKTETGSIRSIILANPSIVTRELPPKKSGPAGGDWPHLCDGNNMLVLKEGVINRTKITENGKKLRKNWSTSYAVLTELFLLFFKDAKTFAMMKTGQSSMAKPDISVDLNGAIVEPGDRASSRKNVYMISTVLGLQVLVQSDNTAVATEWFQEVHGAIRKLPSSFKSQGKSLLAPTEMRKTSGGKQPADNNLLEDPKRFSKIARSRSMKMKRLDDSLEDLSGSAAERQTKIKAKLRRFFQRRPAVELLVKNGIYKDEPAFGSYLSDVCPMEPPRVPVFVKTCIEVLESKEENMKTDGLYRASGNLSQIQKIRLQVDQYKLDVLAQEEDVHVLAGALKLFFRELKEPLIPSSFFKEAVNASMLKKSSAKIQCFREIVKALPPPNYDTLQFLLKHLLRVTSYQEFNRMHIPNLAIVFGPTLMWPAEESANMALDFMQQNLVIECLLSEYNKIFK